MSMFRISVVLAFLGMPMAAFAAGGHDGLSCTGCHSLHKAETGAFIFSVKPNTKELNPRTNQPYTGTTAICLSCHQTPEKGGHGMTPVSAAFSHPFGLSQVNQKVAQVPAQYLNNGRFECTSCHDPHPSNVRAKYLRQDIAGGDSMEAFCAACHASKADPKASSSAAAPAKEKPKKEQPKHK